MKKVEAIAVDMWGETVGYLATRGAGTSFEYAPEFNARALEIAPIEMPLATTAIYKSPEINNTFHGLPGVIADCLPDRYGMRAIEGFFKQHEDLEPPQITPLHRLLYLGDRAMGALEFQPQVSHTAINTDFLKLHSIIAAAKKTLTGKAADVAADILQISASPGGRQAKALVDFNPEAQMIRSGFAAASPGFIPCILKLDGTRDGEAPNCYGRLEHIYALLAKACGIDMPRTYLLEGAGTDGPLAHFVVERFDRTADKTKPVHYGSLCGLLLRDFRDKQSSTYEDYFALTQALTQDATQTEEAFRRAVFNIVLRNQDDHTKNFGFVMNRQGSWRLAPAFDLTYVYGVGASATHQMTLSGKDDGFTHADLFAAGKAAGLRQSRIKGVLDQVRAQTTAFAALAADHGLEEPFAAGISSRFRRL